MVRPSGAYQSFPTQRDLCGANRLRHRFFAPKNGFAAACFIHKATCTRLDRPPRSARPLVWTCPFQSALQGLRLISAPRMNISFK